MNKPQSLVPSKEKVGRAKSKFVYLQSVINSYAASQPYTVQIDEQGETLYVVAHRNKDLPKDIAFELVEAVGHLRSALDKMAMALVNSNNRGTSGVGFPFGGMSNGQPDEFPSRGMERGVKKKFTGDQWLAIEAQKPYPGGNDLLWAVNQIANTDKHGMDLVVVNPVVANRVGLGVGMPFSFKEMTIRPSWNDSFPYDKERVTVLTRFVGLKGYPNINYDISASVVFGELTPVTGKNILTTLNEQIGLTESIVELFSAQFF